MEKMVLIAHISPAIHSKLTKGKRKRKRLREGEKERAKAKKTTTSRSNSICKYMFNENTILFFEMHI